MKPERLSLLATVAAAAALVRLVLTHRVFGDGPVSIALQGVATLLMIWARLTFGRRSFHAAANATRGALVTSGPYAIVRNPIYAAVLLFTFAGVSVHFTVESVALALVVALAMAARIILEERFLRATYPDYADYAHRVKRLVPLVF